MPKQLVNIPLKYFHKIIYSQICTQHFEELPHQGFNYNAQKLIFPFDKNICNY